MKTKHTPGPWHCYQPKNSPRQITDGTMRICTMTNRSEEIGNARLIKAAPDLLLTLREELEALETWSKARKRADFKDVLQGIAISRTKIEDAIAKAGGVR